MPLSAAPGLLAMPPRNLLTSDLQRPGYHFLPPANWMNDPNGLIQWDGALHMFYQYNPLGPWHERIHWGHAVSEDLVHWRDLPIALAPRAGEQDADGCWSGCAVGNHGIPTLIYTGVFPQVVNLATSRDGLISWEKHPANPVISGPPPELGPQAGGHLRDPFVWREDGEWRMVIGCKQEDAGGVILGYRSPDLVQWEYTGPLLAGDQTSDDPAWGGTMWECPNLLQFGEQRALILSPQATPTDHLEPVYHVGRYAGDRLESETRGVLVHGRYFYAPQVVHLNDGRYVTWGWLKEGRSDAACLAAGWNGVMSLPLAVRMRDSSALALEPVEELRMLRHRHWQLGPLSLQDGQVRLLPGVEGSRLEIVAEVELSEDAEIAILIGCSPDMEEQTAIRCGGPGRALVIERSRSSRSDQVQRWPTIAPLGSTDGARLHIFLDHSVVEVFADQGRTVLATRIYPARQDSIHVGVRGLGRTCDIRALDIWTLNSQNKVAG